MPLYEELNEAQQNAAQAWQQNHQDYDAVISETPMPGFTPCYIVCLTSSNGRLYAVGIETAQQVWERCASYIKLHPDFNHDITPIIIAPAVVPDPRRLWTTTEFDWNIPLLRGI